MQTGDLAEPDNGGGIRMTKQKEGFEVVEMRRQVSALCRKCSHRFPGCRSHFGCTLKVQTVVTAWTDETGPPVHETPRL
jgi:hypothetical protein